MPNHLHLILSAEEGVELSGLIRNFKKFTSSCILKAIEGNHQESRRNWMLGNLRVAGEKNKKNKNYQFWRQDNQLKEWLSNAFREEKLPYLHQTRWRRGL